MSRVGVVTRVAAALALWLAVGVVRPGLIGQEPQPPSEGVAPSAVVSPAVDPANHTPTVIAAGDVVTCGERSPSRLTAVQLDSIAGTVLVLGDSVYDSGTDEEFAECYEPTWGRHKERTKPVPGNHEYMTAGAGGYFRYFGEVASPLDEGCTSHCRGYYSYDLGEWHIVALNSEIDISSSSEQMQWLRRDLAENSTTCTLAYWHTPRFSSGRHGNTLSMHALWVTLYEYGVDVALNAHDHDYERFAPQDPAGKLDAERGIRQFVVGTGGGVLRRFERIQPNSELRYNETWGVLKLNLYETSYDWQFLAVDDSVADIGFGSCLNDGSSTKTPAAPLTPTRVPRPESYFPLIR